MSSTVRFGVSMDADLLSEFDAFCGARGYDTRSEALRDLIRDALVEERGTHGDAMVAGTLTLVYDHHKSDLTQRLTAAQHDAHHLILATLHVHLDHYNCLEVLALRGKSGEVRVLAEQILAVKGVKHGKFVQTATGKEFK
ncbi:putative nickel-responsive regulator [uncultured delta proteobacterium]|uniref:Putative nickel-responsive regulator n=1 Tax=uncultured delta proteobacterium TaxID=34034 RepID=A0A212ITG0_9DELT|nr:putative nickel-responsive regulator [uncultured delta proteobacterium]